MMDGNINFIFCHKTHIFFEHQNLTLTINTLRKNLGRQRAVITELPWSQTASIVPTNLFLVPLILMAHRLLSRTVRIASHHLPKSPEKIARTTLSLHSPSNSHIKTSRIMSTTTRIGTEDPRMSKIVIHNNIVYISGQTDGTTSDIKSQTANVLKKVDDLLAQANTDKSKLLTASIWLKDISRDFKDMNEVWNNWVDPNNKPVRATVEANMAREQLLIEVQVTAATE